MAVKITSKQESYYKCGMTHTVEPRVLPNFYFTPEQLDEMIADENLTVEIVKDVKQEEESTPPPEDLDDNQGDENQDPPQDNSGAAADEKGDPSSLTDKVKNFFGNKENRLDETAGRCQGINAQGNQCGTTGLAEGELFCQHHQHQAEMPKG